MDYRKTFLVKPGSKLRLSDIDPGFRNRHESEAAAKAEIERHRERLTKLQQLLYAERKRSVLIVLQAPDAGGKDGTINHVLSALNPQGARVVGFKQPTPLELAHDFLWRVHVHAPARGEIVVFNRSHYEDVLVTRVHGTIDADTCQARYARIREFETLLAEAGTHILKFFLHIGKDEQLARFAQRLNDEKRNWKISDADYAERPRWDDYQAAYQDAIAATSSHHAPWFVIPANHKWFRNLAVSEIIADTLDGFAMRYPEPTVDLAEIRRKYHEAEAEAAAEAKAAAGKAGHGEH